MLSYILGEFQLIIHHYHPPEELSGTGHRSLGCDIGPAPSEPVDIVGVQVFVLLLGRRSSRSYPS